MNSRVRVEDLDSGHVYAYQIVFPKDADLGRNRISVLAPIGTALLGYGAAPRSNVCGALRLVPA